MIKTIIKNLPEIISKNQGGLLDIELHPNYSENKWIYISYSSSNDKNEGTNTSILRFKLNGNQATNQQIIYKALPNSKRSLHYGSRMVFDKDNYLFFSIGDRGNRDLNPQDISIEMVVKSIDYMMTEGFQLTILLLMRKIQKRQFSAMATETHRECFMTKKIIKYGFMSMALEGVMK